MDKREGEATGDLDKSPSLRLNASNEISSAPNPSKVQGKYNISDYVYLNFMIGFYFAKQKLPPRFTSTINIFSHKSCSRKLFDFSAVKQWMN